MSDTEIFDRASEHPTLSNSELEELQHEEYLQSNEKKKIKEFKISCHAIDKIMAGNIGITDIQSARIEELEIRKKDAAAGVPKVKPLTQNMENELKDLIKKRDNPELPDGAKTYCKEWLKKQMFNRKPEWKALVIEKGLTCEPDAIKLISQVYGVENISKNEDYFFNEYMHGSPDILLPEIVRDIKSSWDLFTFPMFDDVLPKKEYWWQLQGYMILTGLDKAALDYCLIDTPKPLVEMDLKKLYYQSGGRAEDWNPETHNALLPNYRFDDIPKELRVKTFEFGLEPWVAEQIFLRVELCRKYIHSLINN